MGPYCKFCRERCFVPIHNWPVHIQKAYGINTIAATCLAGIRLEKEKLGYCYDDVNIESLGIKFLFPKKEESYI